MNKTAALIRTCLRLGAMLANAEELALERLSTYGNRVGLAFQVVDDILDETGTTEELGKDAGSDKERGKATYPALYGMDQSRTYAVKLIDEAQEAISFLGDNAAVLSQLAQYIRTRIN